MRFVRLRFDGLPPTWLQPDGLYCRASDAYHLQRVRMSELANDNFNSERVLCRFARLLRCVPGPRAANRRLQDKANWRSLAPFGRKGLSAHWILQVFATSKWRCATCAGAALRDFPDEFQSCERWRSQCASRRSPAICSPSCALMRFDAIGARQLLCRLFPMSIVASWHAMTVRISGSDLAGPATVEHASIRGRSRSSSRSRSRSARRVAIPGG